MQEQRSATSLLPKILRHSAAACMRYTQLPTWTAGAEVAGSAACPTLQRTCMCGICCRSGGIQGGLSNGELIVAKIAFKPTSTIARKQNTVSRLGEPVELLARGRHDPCVVPRAVPMVEAMAALVLADQLLQVIMQRTHARKRQADRSQKSLIKAPFPAAFSQQASNVTASPGSHLIDCSVSREAQGKALSFCTPACGPAPLYLISLQACCLYGKVGLIWWRCALCSTMRSVSCCPERGRAAQTPQSLINSGSSCRTRQPRPMEL